MIRKIKAYLNGNKDLLYYADTDIEYVALIFILFLYGIWWFISRVFLFITCPIWIIPYCVYISRKKVQHE